MNWREKSRNRLISNTGYEVAATTILCTVRWLANSPNRQLLEVHSTKEKAIEHCEQHYSKHHMTQRSK